MSDIIGARQALGQIATELKRAGRDDLAARVDVVVEKLHRRKAARPRAPVHSAKITPEIRRQVVELATSRPDLHLSEIAAKLGLNPGRVSEILQGDR